MKVSYNWLSQYANLSSYTTEKVEEILTSTGLEVEGTAAYQSVEGGLEGLVIGEVLTCERHPNADKLSITTVNIGEDAPLQIVCGAPNVAAGQKVVVATVGTMLYPAEGAPFKIKKGKIRGESSVGMICAEDEIGLGHSHAGIMVLDAAAEVGTPAADYFEIINDTVYEVGLTPNRSDATGHLGVAFDLVAALRFREKADIELQKPDVSAFAVDNSSLAMEIEVKAERACKRYSGVCIKGVEVKESPDWLKQRLEAIGLAPTNNVVDITNFVLHELGQPLHAFDYGRIAGQKIIVQHVPQDTAFITLDGIERKLDEEDLMICDADGRGLCMAGVFGGLSSGVTEETVDIFLESAYFDATTIRRTSTRHNLRTDAATRYEKGADPNITLYALQRAALLIQELAGGEIASEIIDVYPEPIKAAEVILRFGQIKRILGLSIPKDEVLSILQTLEMDILETLEDSVRISIPTNKADVTREIDVIEEILRIYNFDAVPTPAQVSSALSFSVQPDPQRIRNLVADYLASNSFHEMMALSLSSDRYYKTLYPISEQELVYINNTSNQNLSLMRPTMLFSGLEALIHNKNRQQHDLRLFEFGKTYRRRDEQFVEQQHLTLFMTGQRRQASWLFEQTEVSFFSIKSMVHNVLARLGLSVEGLQQTALDDTEGFAYAMHYHRGPQTLVKFGRVAPVLADQLQLEQAVFYADFHWDNILQALKKHKIKYTPLSKYPAVRRDLALVVDQHVKFADIKRIANKADKKLIQHVDLFDVYENEEHLGKGKKSYAISIVLQNADKTLKDKDVQKVMDKIMKGCEKQLGAQIRS